MGKVPFEGHSSEMKKPSPWLASEDILGKGDVPAVIQMVYLNTDVKADAGRIEKEVYSIAFEGKKKELWLGNINRKVLVAAYGPMPKLWRGKPVLLYVDPNRRKVGGKAGETCNGIGIKIPVGVDAKTGEVVPTDANKEAARG